MIGLCATLELASQGGFGHLGGDARRVDLAAATNGAA